MALHCDVLFKYSICQSAYFNLGCKLSGEKFKLLDKTLEFDAGASVIALKQATSSQLEQNGVYKLVFTACCCIGVNNTFHKNLLGQLKKLNSLNLL